MKNLKTVLEKYNLEGYLVEFDYQDFIELPLEALEDWQLAVKDEINIETKYTCNFDMKKDFFIIKK